MVVVGGLFEASGYVVAPAAVDGWLSGGAIRLELMAVHTGGDIWNAPLFFKSTVEFVWFVG